jgi:predicted regulator of Ras-like GTPase activity (Roadblock/LC7/MglB family)
MALTGDLKDLALVDIIQINCVGRNTARLTVAYPTGEGVFYFQDGDIVDARFGNYVGVEAVYKALRIAEGTFKVDSGMTSPTRTIYEQWAGILMEGMRLFDEDNARGGGGSDSFVSQSQYQALVNDLVKVRGIEGALVATRDGMLQASVNIKSPDRIAALVAFLVSTGAIIGTPAAVGHLQRVTILNGDRKMVIMDQDEFAVALEYMATQRDEVLEPHIQRAFKKLRARRSTGSLGMTGPLGGTGPLGPLSS